MCNKKERKRDRRWYLFPVSTLGAVYFAVHGGTGRGFFFSRRDGAVLLFFRGGTGWLFFFFSTGRDGAVFFFFRGPGRDGCFWRWQFFWQDGAKSLHRPAKGGLNRPASRPCKALEILPSYRITAEKVPPYRITAQKLPPYSITAEKVPPYRITAQKVPPYRITAQKLPPYRITARLYLGIEATSCQSERNFSALAHLIGDLRSNMLAYKVERMMFIRLNRHLVDEVRALDAAVEQARARVARSAPKSAAAQAERSNVSIHLSL